MFNKGKIITIQSKLVDSAVYMYSHTSSSANRPTRAMRCNGLQGCTGSIVARAFVRIVRVCSQKPAHARAAAEWAIACARPNPRRFSSNVLLVRSYTCWWRLPGSSISRGVPCIGAREGGHVPLKALSGRGTGGGGTASKMPANAFTL